MSVLLQYGQDVLTPTKQEVSFLKSKIRKIKAVLTQNASLKPVEVKIGGSLEKGTMLRHKLDADIICIYNTNKDVGSNWRKLVTFVHKDLAANFSNMDVEEAGKLAIHIGTEFFEGENKRNVNFDIVPCYFINSPVVMKDHTNTKLYLALQVFTKIQR
jgi:tRNA nucleotidyltransferase (CCA-adding enzyme)